MPLTRASYLPFMSGFPKFGYANRLRVKLDTSSIGSDLDAGFPVYLPLSGSNGSSALLNHWALSLPATFTFSGTDGDLPDYRYWRASNTVSGSVFIKNNLLHFESSNNGGTRRECLLQPVAISLSGAFDIEISFQNAVLPTNEGNPQFWLAVQNEAFVSNAPKSVYVYMAADAVVGQARFLGGCTQDGWATGSGLTANRTNSFGKLRIARNGATNVITCYYKDGGAVSWTALFSDGGLSTPRMYFVIDLASALNGATSADVSQLVINAGDVLPRTNTSYIGLPSTIVVTDAADNPIPSMITPFFKTNGGIFVKAPQKLYSSIPTELRVYFDKSKNTYWDNFDIRGATNTFSYTPSKYNLFDRDTILVAPLGDTDNQARDSSNYQTNAAAYSADSRGVEQPSFYACHAVNFAASGQLITYNNNPQFNSLRSLTLEVIYKHLGRTPSSQTGRIAVRQPATEADPWTYWGLVIEGSEGTPPRVTAYLSNVNAGSLAKAYSTTTLTVGNTYYIAMTYDYSAKELKIFVNGVREGLTSSVDKILPQGPWPFTVGGAANTAGRHIVGSVGFVRVHRVARSEAWIKAAYGFFAGSLTTWATADVL